MAKVAKGAEMDARPVAGYFRVSQARDDMKAPELYRRDIETFCTYRKLELTEVFSDIAYSAFRGARMLREEVNVSILRGVDCGHAHRLPAAFIDDGSIS